MDPLTFHAPLQLDDQSGNECPKWVSVVPCMHDTASSCPARSRVSSGGSSKSTAWPALVVARTWRKCNTICKARGGDIFITYWAHRWLTHAMLTSVVGIVERAENRMPICFIGRTKNLKRKRRSGNQVKNEVII